MGALIPKDKTMVSQTPLQINTKIKNLFSLIKKNIRQRSNYIIQIYSHHSFIIAMPPRFSILNQTRIMTTIQSSAMINNTNKIKFSSTKYFILALIFSVSVSNITKFIILRSMWSALIVIWSCSYVQETT